MARGGGSARSGKWRGRGQPAVSVLRSEADFADPDLCRERRWLALFLLVHLVDGHGRMGGAYRRVLKRAACDPEHWAHGRSLGGVRAEVNRWIGVEARAGNLPPWDRIADLVESAVDPATAPEVLATARYLHSLASGAGDVTSPDRPRWLDAGAANVTTALIGGPEWVRKHGLPVAGAAAVAPVASPGKTMAPTGTAPAGTALPEPPAAGTPDPERSSYQLLWTVVRVHREAEVRFQEQIAELEAEVRALRQENARLSGDVTSWLGGHRPTVPGQERRPGPTRPVADRHLALEDPDQAFTYPLPAGLPEPRPVRS